MEKKIVLIDGHSIINRAFYGVPDLTNTEGLHTNAIYGFLNIMFKILGEENPTNLLVAFDLKAPTFRHKMYDQYKGTRKPMAEELRQQVPVMKDVLRSMNITVVEQEGVEADDILGTAARMGEREGYLVSLVSGDRDLLQLATEKITIRVPKTKGGKTLVEDYNTQDVIDKFGVTPLQIIDLKGLMGDASDNIPGVPGIGEKTAVKILSKYETVENAIAHVEEMAHNRAKEALKNNTDLATLSKTLATIKTDVDLGIGLEDTIIEDVYNKDAYEWIKRLGFKSILSRFDSDMAKDEEIEKSFTMIKTKVDWKAFFAKLPKDADLALRLVLSDKAEEGTDEDGQFTLFAQAPESRILGVAFSYEGDETHTAFCSVNEVVTATFIKDELSQMVQTHCFVTADLKSQLEELPVKEASQAYDVSIAAYVINPTKNAYTEEDLSDEYFGGIQTGYGQLFGKKKPKEILREMPKESGIYFAYCAYIIGKCKAKFDEILADMDSVKLFNEIEMPLVFTLFDMEQRGIQASKDALVEYGSHLGGRITELEKEIYEAAGEEFNINSPKQLGVILFEKLQLPFAKKTKTGYSTSADVLEKLRLEDPIVDKVLEYRQLTKLKSTYADGLIPCIKEDGRIHSTFNQTITATGRISSTEPNLQNIPIRMELGRQIRKVFVPREGYVFLDADYSQIELRILAHLAGDGKLIQAYKDNEDIHRMTASLVFHTPFDEVTSLQRRNAKAVNFGIIYGISGFGLSRDLNITNKQAKEYIDDYFATYPGVKQYMDRLVAKGKEQGYVTTMYGRRRPIPELSSSNFMQRSFGERIAMNSPIQGTAADIIKIAMIRVNERLKKENYSSQLILQIHDELIIETKEEEQEQVAAILQEEMEHAASLQVPLVAEVESGYTWYDAK